MYILYSNDMVVATEEAMSPPFPDMHIWKVLLASSKEYILYISFSAAVSVCESYFAPHSNTKTIILVHTTACNFFCGNIYLEQSFAFTVGNNSPYIHVCLHI